jgi:hypothetical protein
VSLVLLIVFGAPITVGTPLQPAGLALLGDRAWSRGSRPPVPPAVDKALAAQA